MTYKYAGPQSGRRGIWKSIVENWVTIRGFSFTSAFMENSYEDIAEVQRIEKDFTESARKVVMERVEVQRISI